MFKCILCNKNIENKGIGSHLRRQHNISNQEYYDKYLKKDNEGKCIICGKSTKFDTILTGYRPYCSTRCVNLDHKIRQQIEETSMERFGVPCNLNLEETKIKANTNSQSEEAKAKREATNQERYGSGNVFGSTIIQDKIKATYKEQFGVEYSGQVEEIKQKISNTRKQHTEEQKAKIIQKIYKNKQDKLDEFAKTHNCTLRKEVIALYGNGWVFPCSGLNIEIIKYLNIGFVRNEDLPRIEAYSKINHYSTSNMEKEIQKFVKANYSDTIIENDRRIIHPYEVDLYLPDISLSIEFNGLYWHSIQSGKTKEYHLNKALLCREKGIRLVNIYEFEDLEEQLALLKSLLNGKDLYNPNDFNKNNLLPTIPEPTIIFNDIVHGVKMTIYGAGKLY